MAIVRTTHRAARVGHDRARGEWADMAGCTGPADARGGPGGSPALPCLTGLAGRAAAGLLLALAVLAAIMPMRASAQDKDAARAPNIVIVLADDLGYGDVGYLNSQSQIPTPNLDTLAGQGMAFLDAHSPSAICTPTRYGLLTGRYAWRTRLTRGVLDGYDGPLIAPKRETLGSFLGATGYRTAVIGKWHLGLGFAKNALGEFDFEEPIDDGPHTHGFHESYIIPGSLDFPPYVYIRDGEITGFPLGQQSGMEFPRYMRAGELASDFDPADVLDELIRQATGFIQRQASDGSPFLLYLPLTAPHKPVWPAQRFEGTTELGPYGDFIVQVDAAVGDVMSALDQAGVDDNTLLIVTSDNGSFMSRLDGLDDRDHTDDSTIQAYRAGNHTANHVYRGTKADIWEGGHRVPFFARWPGQIAPGSTREEVISLTDVFATVAEIVGKELPNHAAEDSFSLLPLLRGNPWARPRAAVTHHSIQGMFAIRDGRWKLVAGNGSGGREDPIGQPFERPYQLFDIASDPSEQSNVYDQHPAVAQRLERELERIRSWDRSRMTTDMAALVALYNGTNGANWKTNTNWLSEAPLVSLWDWHGVTTDQNGRVTELDLASNDLSGTIPAELGERNLTKLQRLDLSENELSGPLPLTLSALSQLSVLDIRETTLCAPVNTAFQAWLATIDFKGTVCARPPPPPPPPPPPVPDAPTNLLAVAGDAAVTLTWDAPEDDSGFAITGYEYRIDQTGEWISIGSTDTTHTVTGLVNGTEYVFQVRAVTAAGSSAPSNRVEATPRAAVTLLVANFSNGNNGAFNSRVYLWNPSTSAGQVTARVFTLPLTTGIARELTGTPLDLGTLEARSALNLKLVEDILIPLGIALPYTTDGGNLTLEFTIQAVDVRGAAQVFSSDFAFGTYPMQEIPSTSSGSPTVLVANFTNGNNGALHSRVYLWNPSATDGHVTVRVFTLPNTGDSMRLLTVPLGILKAFSARNIRIAEDTLDFFSGIALPYTDDGGNLMLEFTIEAPDVKGAAQVFSSDFAFGTYPLQEIPSTSSGSPTVLVANFTNGNNGALHSRVYLWNPSASAGEVTVRVFTLPQTGDSSLLGTLDLESLQAESARNLKLAEDILAPLGIALPYVTDGGNLTLEFTIQAADARGAAQVFSSDFAFGTYPMQEIPSTSSGSPTVLVANFMNGNDAALNSRVYLWNPSLSAGSVTVRVFTLPLTAGVAQELTTAPLDLGTLGAESARNLKLVEDILTPLGIPTPYVTDGGNLTLEFTIQAADVRGAAQVFSSSFAFGTVPLQVIQ